MGNDSRMPRGGVGEFLPPVHGKGFGLKIVRRKTEDGRRNENFWNEARSIHFYCASVRFLSGGMKIPLAAHYYQGCPQGRCCESRCEVRREGCCFQGCREEARREEGRQDG